MSIVTMKKATLAGSIVEKDKIVSALQQLGMLHIVPLVASGKKPPLTCDDINEAIKYLRNSPKISSQQNHDKNLDIENLANEILEHKNEHQKIKEKHQGLYYYIELIKDWGDFKLPSVSELGGYKMHFFKMDKKALQRLKEQKNLAWQVVHQSNDGIDYIVVIVPENKEVKITGAQHIEFLELSLSQAELALAQTNLDLQENVDKKIELSCYLEALEKYKDKLADQIDYKHVYDYSLNEDGFFVLHGWIAGKNIKDLKKFAEKNTLALMLEEPSDDDEPPTLLANNALGAPGEELVKFYQMPAYKMWDPSTAMFLSFALFFAMIMSDFGYGILMTIITALTWKKMSRGGETSRRIRNMLMMLSGSCLIYGIICGSYFGYEAPIEALKSFHKVDVNNFDEMIKLSVGIGAIHIIIANIIRFFNACPKLSALSFIGWIAVVIGGYSLYAVGQETLWAQYSLISGFVAILLLSSDRPFSSVKNIIMRPIDGLLNLTNATKAFGDCLSYIRLFALGLSSALLAASFNSMAEQAISANTVIGTGLGILVYAFGHALNLVLGIIGGLVHGLRLNFIEFSNWALSGEGYQFKPFESKETKKWKN